jgi:CRISPR-associated endonuclease Cas1
MAAATTVTQSFSSHNFVQQEFAPKSGVITLFGYGIGVRVHRGHLILEDGVGTERRAWRLPRVGHGLRRLVVIGSDGNVSLAALRWLADQDAAFVMLDRVGEVLVTTGPVRSSDARLRRAQSLAQISGTARQIAIELIKQKLLAQERLIRDHFPDEESIETISKLRHGLVSARSNEEIRRYEAHAALAYWKTWHHLGVMFAQSDLRHVPEHWRIFGSRLSPLTKSPRIAVNPPNAILNYLYALLESEARQAISELGLDPGLGFLHSDTRTRDSLACDLMEPIRPKVDAYLLDWLQRTPLQRKWFFEERNGNCRLMGEFAVELSETSRIWRLALSPFAEWIAHTLWSSTLPSSLTKAPATRLTQNRKREAKGIPSQPLPNRTLTTQNFIRTALANNRPMAAKFARLSRFDPVAQSRRADTQRRQAGALRSWNPTENPGWLDEKFYREQIQPRLVSLETRSIQSAISVSQAYALKIRASRCVPHKRHWPELARLVSVSPDG